MNNTGSKYNSDAACLIGSYHVFLSIVLNYGNAECKDISDVASLIVICLTHLFSLQGVR